MKRIVLCLVVTLLFSGASYGDGLPINTGAESSEHYKPVNRDIRCSSIFELEIENIEHVGWCYSFWGTPRKLLIQGDYLYMITEESGFQIVDISDPATPEVVGMLPSGDFRDMEIEGDYAYLRTWQYFIIIDISDRLQPRPIFFYDDIGDGGLVGDMTAGYGWAFFGSYWSDNEYGNPFWDTHLFGLDITSPENPELFFHFGQLGGDVITDAMCVSENYLYFWDNGEVLVRVFTNPPVLPVVGRLGGFGYVFQMEYKHEHVFTISDENGFSILDVDDPERPRIIGNLAVDIQRGVLNVGDQIALFKENDTLVQAVDIGSFEEPEYLCEWDSPERVTSVAIENAIAAVSTHPQRIDFFDLSNGEFDPIASMTGEGYAHDVQVVGDLGYLCTGEAGFRIVDLTDMGNIQEISHCDIPGNAMWSRIHGNNAFVVNQDSAVYYVDISFPDSPLVSDAPLPIIGEVVDMALDDDIMYLIDYPDYMQIYDVVEPNAIDSLDAIQIDPDFHPNSLSLIGDYIYLGGEYYFGVIDLNGNRQLRTCEVYGRAVDIVADDDFIYVADSPLSEDYYPTIWIYERENPADFEFVNCYFIENCSRIDDIIMHGDFIVSINTVGFIRPSSYWLEVLNVSNPYNLFPSGWHEMYQGGRSNIAIRNDYILSANLWSFDAYDISGALSIERQPVVLPTSPILLSAYPNPFNHFTLINFNLPKSGLVSLAVFDESGRRIADLADSRQFSAGRHSLGWDAVGMPSGNYLLQLEFGGQQYTNTAILIK